MKSVKKFSLGLVALISLISVVFITASPNGVQATHDTTTHDAVPVATQAAVAVSFYDSTSGTGELIWTIEWSSANCVAPIGGVIHSVDGRNTVTPALGATGNQGGYQLITHNSVDGTSETSIGNIDPCEYTLTVTSSLQCTIDLDINSAGANAGTATTAGANLIDPTSAAEGLVDAASDVPNRASVSLQGSTSTPINTANDNTDAASIAADAATAAAFFSRDKSTVTPTGGTAQVANDGMVDVVPPEIANLDRVVVGALADSSASATPILTNANTTGNTAGAATYIVSLTATACNSPIGGGGAIRLHSAEPAGSIELAADITPVSGCTPSGTRAQGEQSVRPGTSNELETVALDSNCRYTLTVGHAVSQTLDATNGALVLCEARAWAYQVTDAASPVSTTGVAISDADVGDDAHSLSFSRTGNNIFLDDSTDHFVRLTLYISSNCPTYGQFSLAYNVLSSTSPSLHQTPVSPTITPVTGSADVCRATPALVNIRGRNEVVGVDGVATTGSTVNNIAVDVGIVIRPRQGSACRYDIQYPLVSGALQLAFEHGGRADDPTTGSTNDPMNEFSTPDNVFDGRITVSAITLNTNTYTFTYVTRALPISVTMQFPDEVEFTTNDQVDYLISVPGACARFSPILGRALGNTGTFRSPQAYPGSTLIYDRSLQALESQNSKDSDLLYTLEPVVIVSGQTFSCSVQVEELSTPAGCEVLGTNPRTLTYAADLEDFSFSFEHDCSVLIEEIGGRSITA